MIKAHRINIFMVFAVIFLATSLYFLTRVWLMMFGAILVAVLLLGLSDYLKRAPKIGKFMRKLPHALSVGLVALMLLLVVSGFLAMFGSDLVNQFEDLKNMTPNAMHSINDYLKSYPVIYYWLAQSKWMQEFIADPTQFLSQYTGDVLGVVPMMVSSLFGGIGSFLIILVVGLFLALTPDVYTKSFVTLVPKQHRDKARYLLKSSYQALRRWLVGQFVVMAFVGVSTGIALWLMGIPFALALGVIAFVLDFVPVLGPWLSAVPILLVTLIVAPDMLLWALLMIVVVQQLESYVVAPVVQQRLIDLPPVALLLSQIIMGSLTGILGVALAMPLIVGLIVWVQILYVKFTLKDYTIKVMGQNEEDLERDPYYTPKDDQQLSLLKDE